MEIFWLAAYYIYSVGGYYWFSNQSTERHLQTPWDKFIPTLPVFVIPYLAATLAFLGMPIFLFIKLGWLKTKAYLIAQVIATGIGYLVYWVYPTSVVRNPIVEEGFLANVLKWIHANDGTTAAFPSGHVYHTTVISYFLWIYFPVTRPYVAIFLLLVMAATVTLKQHYLPDILGGIVVATIAILVTNKFFPNN